MKFVKILQKYRYQILLFILLFVIFWTNYKPGTYLSGWDNLQTELNPGLGVKRAFFSVWEEYQSFGLTAGMAHAADLPRAVFLWIVSFLLPQNVIRYFYHFLMLLLGGIGMFKLLKLDPNLHTSTHSTELRQTSRGDDKNLTVSLTNHDNWPAFLGALFYMLNLGTVQIFYLPFESFSTFFAFLPWGIWIFFKITNLKHQISRKDILVFFLINFLGTPSFYTQHLFLVYILTLLCLAAAQLISYRENLMVAARRWLFSFGLIFLINSFWLLPQIYFIKNSSNVVYEAKANQLATEDVYYKNKEKGTLPYYLKLEGFYFDLFDKNNQYLFLPWKNHFQRFFFLQYFFSFLFIFGIVRALRKKDYRFIFLLIITAILLLNRTWPISLLDSIIRENKLVNQIFRSPFTKFIIPYSLLYSYFVVRSIELIFLKSLEIYRQRSSLIIFIFLLLIIIYSLPSFQGFFIAPEMKIKIPQDYFKLFSYFQNENKNKRIALLPEYTFWGWFHHRWGYNGSGFLWYGIEQPIVSRTFDVWSDKSEGYFWEAKSALQAEDSSRFENVLEKYQINYLILDYSLSPVVSSMKGLQYDRLEKILNESQKISLVRKWENLALYQVNQEKATNDFVWTTKSLTHIEPKIKLTDKDTAYEEFGNYYTNSNQPSIIFPFLNLTSVTRLKNRNWEIVEKDNQFIIKSQLDFNLSDYQLTSFNNRYQAVVYQNEKLARYSVSLQTPKVSSHQLSIAFNKELVEKITPQNLSKTKTSCFINITCFGFWLPNLPQRYAYLIKIKNKNYSGRRLFFYILDQTKKQNLIEERLKKDVEYFILPPKYQYGLGYSINFQENASENLKSKNDLTSLEVYLFPYENLKKLKLVNQAFYRPNNRLKDKNSINAKKINYFTYRVTIDNNLTKSLSNSFLILSQSFHPGWKAYRIKCQNSNLKCQISTFFPFFFGQELKNHVLVNNWANGWEISQNVKIRNSKTNSTDLADYKPIIIIIFWPQFLEFLGFGLLIGGAIFVLKYNHEKRN